MLYLDRYGVVNGAKGLGEMHGAELAPTRPRSQLQSSRIKVSIASSVQFVLYLD